MVQKDIENYCHRLEIDCPHKISKTAKICFIIMAYEELYSENIEKILKKAIKSVLKLNPILAKGIKKRGSTDLFCTKVCKPIKESTYCVVDATYTNTNVGIEYALAQGFKKPVILTMYKPKIKSDISPEDLKVLTKLRKKGNIQYFEMPVGVPSDVKAIFSAEYKDEKELKKKLKQNFEVIK